MTPNQALASHRAMIEQSGETIIVRRWRVIDGEYSKVEASIFARVMGYNPTQVIGAITQGDIRVIALNDPAATVPAGMVPLSTLLPLLNTDKLVIRGEEKAIKGVDDNTRRIAGVLIALDIHAEG